MKHPHSEVLKKVLDDSSLELEYKCNHHEDFKPIAADYAMNDSDGDFIVRIKQKPNEYQVFRDAINDGKKIEKYYNDKWNLMVTPLLFGAHPNLYRIHDEYRELREAQDAGKRIAMVNNGLWTVQTMKCGFCFPASTYKIVEDDIVDHGYMTTRFGMVNLKLTKSGLIGEITVEVVK